MRRLTCTGALAAALSVFAVSAAYAAPPSPDNPAGREILGVVPVHGQASKGGGSGSNLTYHYGPVVHGDQTFAIYWNPSGFALNASYRSLIDGFFSNVATANSHGQTGSTYWSDTQYGDGSGLVSFGSSAWRGSVVDSSAFPASGCSDSVSQTTVCLSDAQLRAEIDRVVAANGWPRDGRSIYFLFTPKNVGSCYSSSSCAFSSYCAYHSSFSSNGTVLYANQPYTGTAPSACGSGQSPNGDADADSTINVASHEHNEAITDPLGNAWYDRRGYENADKCAWNFGSQLGATATGAYNQLINGGTYYVQQNWSNAQSGCVLTGV